jgi:hypothetical protein
MAVGVATPVVPVANDIILGEFNAYVNYGLPTQTLLGATSGGCKIDIDRKIKEVKFDGAYGKTLDSNGVPLVRYDSMDVTFTLKNLYLKYFHNKIISDCESTGTWESQDWALTGGTYAAETTIVLEGDQSAKCTGAAENYGIHEVFASSKNLTVFANSETSTTADYIGFAIYITSANRTALGATAKIRLSIHKDAEDTETNYFKYEIGQSSLTADVWNVFKIAKSSFTEAGTASWSAVTGISFKFAGAAPTSSCVFYVDSISLIHNQDVSAPVPVNGSGFGYTNETTYRAYRPSLEIASTDYLENVTLVGQRFDGKKMKMILKNCLNDGKISLALQEKTEVVNDTQFSGHYKYGAATTCPFTMKEYIA